MRLSSRAALATMLSLVGLASLIAQSHGQQAKDQEVQKTTNQAQLPKPLPPASVASVDIDAIFKGYEKFKDSTEAFKADLMARQGELNKLVAEGKQAGEMLAKLQQGTPDFKKLESRITDLKAQFQAKQEQAQAEFSQREADQLAMIYKDVQNMVAAVARQRHLTFVVKASKAPVSSLASEMVMDSISRTVVYADPATDITNDVLYYLNRGYRASTDKPIRSPNAGVAAPAGTAPGAAAPNSDAAAAAGSRTSVK